MTADSSYELSAEWCDWVVENALEGAVPSELVDAIMDELEQEGARGEGLIEVTRARVELEVAQLLDSSAMRAAQLWRRRALRFKKLNALRVALHRAHGPREIERRSGVSPAELYGHFVRACQPVILTDIVDEWPAITRWTDDYLKEQLGDLMITCCAGRDRELDYNRNIERFFTEMSFGDFVDAVASSGETNDLYLVGNNRVLERPGVDRLLADLDDKVVAYLDGPVRPKRSSFWFGPGGTFTTLHHDPTSVLYAQIRGQKRFRLLSPGNEPALLAAHNTYSEIDLEEAARFMGDRVYEVTLSPGELLLLPAGWWHEVKALSTSISLGLTNLQGPTSFKWYYPGKIW